MLVLVGVNHQSASVDVRERLAFAEGDLPGALERLTATPAVDEAMILSTCNRVEILARADDARQGLREVLAFLARERSVDAGELDACTYHYLDRDAVRHLYRVAAGLDSMVLGEPQILGQVKQAYAAAKSAGTVGTIVEHLLQRCLASAKRVRTRTGISRHAVSIAYAAVELARRIFGDLGNKSVLLLGAGKMGALVATHLAHNGVDSVHVASRTFQRSQQLADQIGGHATRWDDAFAMLDSVDIVVSGTAAPGIILDAATVKRHVRARRSRSLFLIDIAVPRDIAPEVNKLEHVYLYDVDDLQGVVEDNLAERRRQADQAAAMIDEEVEAFERWVESLKIAPTIVALRESLLVLCDQEFERHRKHLGPLDGEQEEGVRRAMRGLMQKVLHRPIVHLKGSAERGDLQRVSSLYREIFGIDPPRADAQAASADDGDLMDDDDPRTPPVGPMHLLRGGKEDAR